MTARTPARPARVLEGAVAQLLRAEIDLALGYGAWRAAPADSQPHLRREIDRIEERIEKAQQRVARLQAEAVHGPAPRKAHGPKGQRP